MEIILQHNITLAAQYWFQTIVAPDLRRLVPEPDHRIPLSLRALPFFLFPMLGLVLMAHLVQRPGTHVVRMLCMPIVVLSTIGASFNFKWMTPSLNVYNWAQCLLGEVMIAKSLEFGFSRDGRRKLEKARPGQIQESVTSNGNGSVFEKAPKPMAIERPSYVYFVPPWLSGAIELCSSLRGLGWDFGRDVYIPKHTRPLERVPFLRATIVSFIRNYIALDLLEWLLKFFPGVGSTDGGSIFYPQLPLLQRYAVSTTIHIISGSCLITGFWMCYDLLTIFCVAFLHDPPSSWPPVMDDPWSADSLHTFWSKRWHQLFRQTFIVFGGYPGKFVAGNIGMVFGTFIASGLYHECAIYSMGSGFDYRVPLYFAAQGPLLVLERVWRIATGRRVGGWPGRLWVYFVILVAGQPMVDAWHMRGVGGGMIIPPLLSPARLLLFPAISAIATWWQH